MRRCLVAGVLGMWLLAAAAPVRAAGAGLPEYVDALDALERADWAGAIAFADRALAADSDSAAFTLARGVARTLAERLDDAETDLNRVLRLGGFDREAKLWLASVVAMKGQFQRDSTIFPAATNDLDETAVRTMSRDYGELAFRRGMTGADRAREDEQLEKQRRDRERFGPRLTPEQERQIREAEEHDRNRNLVQVAEMEKGWLAKREKAKAAFPKLGAQFARRAKTSVPDLVPLLVTRGKDRHCRGEFALALRDLRRAAEQRPDDAEVLFLTAGCELALGAPGAARERLTRLLTIHPPTPEAFFTRAMAGVAMGDRRRAEADLAAASELRPAEAAQYRQSINVAIERLGATPQKAKLPELLRDLQRQAAANAGDEALIAKATELLRAVHGHRLRADESYLDRRRTLERLVAASPNDAGKLADLGEFLYREATTTRGEAVEPRASFRTYRPQAQADELPQAERALDAALQADPNSVKALTFKAACLMWRLQYGDAETLLNKALAIDGTYPQLLDVFSQLLDHAAGVKASKAADLRTVKTWEDYHWIYYRRPSQAELDQADAYDAQAERLWKLAEQHLERAVALHKGTADGFFYAGVLARRRGQLPEAQAAFIEAAKLAPADARPRDQLSAIYAARGMSREAFEAQAEATNLSHTTAGPMLRYAWTQIVRTAWRASRDALDRAMSYDPADPRVAAYLAVVAEAEGNAADALAWYRTAAAIEEARAAMAARSFRIGDAPLAPADAAEMLHLNLRIGRLQARATQPDASLGTLQANTRIVDRIAEEHRYGPVAASMLPDPTSDPHSVPEAETIASLAAWSRLEAGRALLSLGRRDEAVAEFEQARAIEKACPSTIDPGTRMREPVAWATFGICNVLLARKDMDGASKVMSSYGRPWGLSAEAEAERKRLNDRILKSRQQASDDDRAKQAEEDRRRRDAALEDIRRRQAETEAARQRELEEILRRQRQDPRKR